MVGTIKKWLGIDALERENWQLAKALKSAHERLSSLRREYQGTRETLAALGTDVAALQLSHENSLTSEPAKTKIVPKPHRATWKSFRTMAEKASEAEE